MSYLHTAVRCSRLAESERVVYRQIRACFVDQVCNSGPTFRRSWGKELALSIHWSDLSEKRPPPAGGGANIAGYEVLGTSIAGIYEKIGDMGLDFPTVRSFCYCSSHYID